MSTQTFVPLPEKATATDLWSLQSWLPAWTQVRTALALQVEKVIEPWHEETEEVTTLAMTSMRQGLGLVVAAAVVGGFLPFLVNWIQATQMGTALPLAQWARSAEQQSATVELTPFLQAWTETARTMAGLTPNAPPWLAAGLSALGAWVDWPLTWLTLWLVYGLGVLVAIKAQGATTTLPHFYAATGYAFVPLALFGLRPLPYLGVFFGLAGIIWSVLIYSKAVRTLSRLSTPRVVMSLVVPLAVALLVSLIGLGILSLVFLPLLF